MAIVSGATREEIEVLLAQAGAADCVSFIVAAGETTRLKES